MFWTRLVVSLAEFGLALGLSIFVVFWSYRSFARFNADAFDAEKEILRGNVAVSVLMASLTFAAALVMQETIYPVVSILRLGLTAPGGPAGYGLLLLFAYAAGHLLLGFLLSVGTVEVALRLFETLNREIDEQSEIAKGNVAVAVIMGAVVLIVAMFMQQGVGSVSKSLIPQPKLGALRVMD
ncbi:MAG: hypothetical protein KGL53_00685 [Elusimicrobia bacterium]|nr:hypothetical protein [Elusimicrobiota bacterium]